MQNTQQYRNCRYRQCMSIFNKDMSLGTISDSYTSTITILYKGKKDLKTETVLHTTTFKMFTSKQASGGANQCCKYYIIY